MDSKLLFVSLRNVLKFFSYTMSHMQKVICEVTFFLVALEAGLLFQQAFRLVVVGVCDGCCFVC